jgi:hypothetical protein
MGLMTSVLLMVDEDALLVHAPDKGNASNNRQTANIEVLSRMINSFQAFIIQRGKTE